MADSMVTSMARAGFSEAWSRFPNDFGPSFDHDADLFEAIARRMIGKMREPTDGMLARADSAIPRFEAELDGSRLMGVDGAKDCWQAMCDAALAPNPPADEREHT